TANFATSFLLTTAVSPPNGGTIAAVPPSADGYYAPGTTLQLTATPAQSTTFSGWSGALTGTANPQSLVLNAPASVTATFAPTTCGYNYTLDNRNFAIDAAGGTQTVNITASAGCFWQTSLSQAFINPFVSIANGNGFGNGSFQFTVAANA